MRFPEDYQIKAQIITVSKNKTTYHSSHCRIILIKFYSYHKKILTIEKTLFHSKNFNSL